MIDAVHGKRDVSDAEWEQFVSKTLESSNAVPDAKQMCENYEARLRPIRAAMSSLRLRVQMGHRLGFNKIKAKNSDRCLVSRGRKIYKNNPYNLKTTWLKLLHSDDKLCEYKFLAVNFGLI